MVEKNLQWRGMKIQRWETISAKNIIETPDQICAVLESIGLPVRVYINNILKPELAGILVGIKKENSGIIIQIKPFETRRRKEDATVRLTMEAATHIEIPVLE